MERQMKQNEATEVRRPNYNDPACGKDLSEDEARYERRMGDNSKPAPSDPYKKGLVALVLALAMSGAAYAQDWQSLYKDGDASYLGGYYAAVSMYCMKTNYTNDSGLWASGEAKTYEKGCAQGVWDAMKGKAGE